MAWCRPSDKPLSEPKMVSLLAYVCVTRHQWINLWSYYLNNWESLMTGQLIMCILDKSVFFGHASMFVLVTIHTYSSDEYNWPWCHDVVWSTVGIATDLYTCICLRGTCLTHSRSTIMQFQCHILSNDLAGVSEISINRMCYGILSYVWIYNGVYLWSVPRIHIWDNI